MAWQNGIMMSDDYDSIRALIAQRQVQRPTRRKPRLPDPVIQDLKDKEQNARELGCCEHCDFMLVKRYDGRLGTALITEQGNAKAYSLRCSGPNGHELDPARITFAGRRYLQPVDDGNESCQDPQF